jgi:bifunctional DNA-binding transcriptional regulator/antitoxin component of YhaV-PrlF toxin-antitoxin module
MFLMKMTERGTITVPKHLRERYGLGPNVDIEFVPDEKGLILKKKVKGQDPVSKWRGVLKTPPDVDAYIEEVRGR